MTEHQTDTLTHHIVVAIPEGTSIYVADGSQLLEIEVRDVWSLVDLIDRLRKIATKLTAL